MDRILAAVLLLVLLATSIFLYPEQAGAVLLLILSSIVIVLFINYLSDEPTFLQRVFIIGLVLRIAFGLLVYIFELQGFFGADANTYHTLGSRLYEIWFQNIPSNDPFSQTALSMSLPGWGMNWICGAIYSITGPNMLASQFFCAVIGAATAPMLYGCALKIFNNRNVAKYSAFFVAVFPACVIWSAQLLKDGLIIFLLVLVMTMVLKLQEKLDYFSIIVLILALFGITSLRFYIFYVVAVAVIGSFVVGSSKNQQTIIKRLVACLLVGIGLAYLGGFQNVSDNIEKFGNLEKIQKGRKWSAKVSDSGYGEDTDVSTTGGAIEALPVGFSYLMFAPFPWQATNLRQAIAVPETLLWWASMPLLIVGIGYTLKNRLRSSIAIILFTVLLTLIYSITQSNVGTAYRQRTQIQVFLFMFVAVGWQLRKEKQEIKKLESAARKRKLIETIQKNKDQQ